MRAGWAAARAAAVATALLLLPRLAEGCPMCASQHPGGTARIVALGVMLLFPFCIAVVLFGALRRLGGDDDRRESRGGAATDAGRERAGGSGELNL